MDDSVLVYRNHQNADMDGYDFQVIVYPTCHHSPEKLLRFLMTSYLCQQDFNL